MENSEIEYAITRDGTGERFPFVNNGRPKKGASKEVFFSPKGDYAIAFYKKGLDSFQLERLKCIVGSGDCRKNYKEMLFNSHGGDYWKKCFCWPQRIVYHSNGKIGFMMPVYPSHFFGRNNRTKTAAWLSPRVYNKYLEAEEKGNLQSFLSSLLMLNRAIRKLHNMGMAHGDISLNNCLIDPVSGTSCVIDIDGLVVPGLYPPDVHGSPEYMAPEIVVTKHLQLGMPGKILPSCETDLHSLAVLNYFCLFHRHPLEGSCTFGAADTESQEKLTYGQNALFVENPNDRRNRPMVKQLDDRLPWVDVERLPYTIIGKFLQQVIEKAFIAGLHSPKERPTAGEWENAFRKTQNLLLPCSNESCSKKYFVCTNEINPRCPYCGTSYNVSFPILEFYSERKNSRFAVEELLGYNGCNIYQWHTDRTVHNDEFLTDEQRTPVASILYKNKTWQLVNHNIPLMKNLATEKNIKPHHAVELKNNLQILLPNERFLHIHFNEKG